MKEENLKPMEMYLFKTKCYGTKKVRFIERNEVHDKREKPYFIYVFHDSEMNVNWISENLKEVSEIVEML